MKAFLALGLVATLTAVGCVVHPHDHHGGAPPPPPRETVVVQKDVHGGRVRARHLGLAAISPSIPPGEGRLFSGALLPGSMLERSFAVPARHIRVRGTILGRQDGLQRTHERRDSFGTREVQCHAHGPGRWTACDISVPGGRS